MRSANAGPVADARWPAEASVPPARPTVLVERMGDEVILKERRGPTAFYIVGGGFLLLWWAGWTVGCASLTGRIIAQPSLETIVFAVPLLDAWFFALLLLCANFFGRTCVRLGPDGLAESWTILLFRGRRHVPLDEIKGIVEFAKVVDSESGRTEHGIKIVTVGKAIRFALGTKTEERGRLIVLLQEHLETLRRGSAGDRDAAAADGPRSPSDSEITLQRDWDRLAFVRTGPPCGGMVAALTFLNLFWNGATAGFLLELTKHFSWGLCLFLIPFEIVGAVMLATWLWVLVAPWRRREWDFGSEAITTRVSVLGLGRTRTFDPLSLDHVELRKDVRARGWLTLHPPPDEEEDRSFALGVVDSGGSDAFVIAELTEGEARWMESEVRPAIRGRLSGRTMLAPAQGPVWDRWLDGPR